MNYLLLLVGLVISFGLLFFLLGGFLGLLIFFQLGLFAIITSTFLVIIGFLIGSGFYTAKELFKK